MVSLGLINNSTARWTPLLVATSETVIASAARIKSTAWCFTGVLLHPIQWLHELPASVKRWTRWTVYLLFQRLDLLDSTNRLLQRLDLWDSTNRYASPAEAVASRTWWTELLITRKSFVAVSRVFVSSNLLRRFSCWTFDPRSVAVAWTDSKVESGLGSGLGSGTL